MESLLPLRTKTRPKFKDIERSLASTVLLTTYITQGCERENNHWALFEAWVTTGSYILAMAQRHSVPEIHWKTPFDLAELAVVRSLEALADECQGNDRLFTQGNPLSDGACYGPRITLLSGRLSALNLHRRIRGDAPHPFVEDFLNRYIRKVNMWGESAVPYLWLAALEAEQRGQHSVAEGLIFRVLSSVVEVNGRKGRALPSPYWGPEEALRLAIGFNSTNRETFDGHSYTAEPLIDFLVRRLVRRSLASIWEKITKVQFTEFLVTEPREWFCWRAEHGSLKTTMPGMPESWARLQAHAEARPEKLPPAIISKPNFAVFFPLVFPHRFGCELVKLIERALTTR